MGAVADELLLPLLPELLEELLALLEELLLLLDDEPEDELEDELEDAGLRLLLQGRDGQRRGLLDKFRSAENNVLFGTASFWQGVDVQGRALRNVILHKLPFAVPDEPVQQARIERIGSAGGNGFMDYSVPEAVIKLRQGFGRLIRSGTDKGIIVLLDGRILTRRYGRHFLAGLPDVEVSQVDHRVADG